MFSNIMEIQGILHQKISIASNLMGGVKVIWPKITYNGGKLLVTKMTGV